MRESADFLMNRIADAISRIDDYAVKGLVESIIGSNTVFVYGVGRSGLVGKSFSVRLVQMGLDVHFVGDMTTPIVRKGDLTLIISNTGSTMSAVQTANISRRMGSRVVSITSDRRSKLGLASNLVIEVVPEDDDERGRHAPLGTLFEVTTQIFLDSIVPDIMVSLGESEHNMSKRHAIWV